MITSKDCWLKARCKKGINPDSDCNQCDIFCPKLYKLNELYDRALLPEAQKSYLKLRIDANGADREQFANLKEIEKQICGFVEAGANLYLYSANTGNGKTSWAIRLVQAYLSKIWISSDISCRALYICVPQFLLALKDNISERNDYVNYILKNINSADLVIWDDVATKTFTQYEREHLFALINDRLVRKQANIFTSNLSPKELDNYTGKRLYSRIVNSSKCIEFTGLDKRGI